MSRHGRFQVDAQQELVGKALKLRQERLKQERIEMQYLQQEAQTTDEVDADHHRNLSEKIMLSMTAKARIDMSVNG